MMLSTLCSFRRPAIVYADNASPLIPISLPGSANLSNNSLSCSLPTQSSIDMLSPPPADPPPHETRRVRTYPLSCPRQALHLAMPLPSSLRSPSSPQYFACSDTHLELIGHAGVSSDDGLDSAGESPVSSPDITDRVCNRLPGFVLFTAPACSTDEELTRDNHYDQLPSAFNTGCKIIDQQPRPVRLKKHVAFADERGQNLAQTRIMYEPSDVPPVLHNKAVLQLLNTYFPDDEDESIRLDQHQHGPSWFLEFQQPASDYASFRRKLEQNKIALENVILKNVGQSPRLSGSIRVANLSFSKSVFVRLTDNNWITYTDRNATYSASPAPNVDVFTFEFQLPCDNEIAFTAKGRRHIDFAVCYRENDAQPPIDHWDNNNGLNYGLGSKSVVDSWASLPDPVPKRSVAPGQAAMSYDLPHADTDWGKFAAWNDLKAQGPYW